jgi:uncharacterized protein YggL (DUF469 family)
MKKRIRKKLHVGEFCEYGVEFDLKVTSSVSEDEFDTLIENFIEDLVEGNGLYCGGGWHLKEKTSGMVVETGRDRKVSREYAARIEDWFKSKNLEYTLDCSLIDLWYPERKIT